MTILPICVGLFVPMAEGTSAVRELPSAAELFQRLAPSIVVVEGLDSWGRVQNQGSGVVLFENSVVTNQHVVAGAASVLVRQGKRNWSAAPQASGQHDLALLFVLGLEGRELPKRPFA